MDVTREKLLSQRADLVMLKAKLENTWNQTVGKIELIDALLAEEKKSPQPEGGEKNGD